MAPWQQIYLSKVDLSLAQLSPSLFFIISETLDMSSKQLGEMFEGDSADMSGGKFPLMSMGG